MFTFTTQTHVDGLRGRQITDFLLNATDRDYQAWWPGVHLQLHTIKRYPNNIGNLVYMDEYIGRFRARATSIVLEAVPGKRIVYQLKKLIRWPAWLTLEVEDDATGVTIKHTLSAGYKGMGRILDPLFRTNASEEFRAALSEHVKTEFPMLREMLRSRE